MSRMKIIRDVAEMIDEEIEDAKKYAEKAIMTKTEKPMLSRTMAAIAEEELGHMSRLHAQVTEIIAEYKKEKGDPPEAMRAVYEYLHEKQVRKTAEVKRLLAMYKE